MNAQRRALYEAQQRIFNKLCAAFRRSHQNPEFRLLTETVRAELNIPLNLFTEALESFSDACGKPIVVAIEHNGKRYITLGESAKSNVSDWPDTPRAMIGFHSLTTAKSKRVTNGLRYAEPAIRTR